MKIIIKNIFFFTLSFFSVLIFLDIFINFSYIETKSPTDFEEKYGRCRKKNMDYLYFNEGFSIGKFNEGRYVNSYYPKEKPSNVLRIAAVGDSYVEGFQVFERNHFLKITEEKLNKKYPDSIQILNFGRSGFDFGDMYVYFKTLIDEYNCDLILFFVSNEDLDIKQKDVLIPKLKYVNKELSISNDEMPDSYKKSFINQVKFSNSSTLYKMLNDSRKLVKSGKLAPKLLDKFYTKKMNNINDSIDKENNITISDLSLQILNKLKTEENRIIIVNIDKVNLDTNFTKKISKPLLYFNLSQESELYKNENKPHYWDISKKYGHWNIEAHKIVADKLEKFLKRN